MLDDDDDVWARGCFKAASATVRADPYRAQGKAWLHGVHGVGGVMAKGSSTEWNRSRRSSLKVMGMFVALFSPETRRETPLPTRVEFKPVTRAYFFILKRHASATFSHCAGTAEYTEG